MIRANKSPIFNRLFVAYAKHRLRGTFTAVRVAGLDHATQALARGPVVFVANHASWWDSLMLMWLANYPFRRAGPSDGFAMMDAVNLRRFPFFRRLGVFGVDLDDPADRAAVLDHAAGLLDGPGRHVWIFPQGAERPVTERPVRFKRGAAVIAAAAGAAVIPVALRFEHGRHPTPDAYVHFGPSVPVTGDVAVDIAAQEAAVEALMDTLEEAVRAAARREDVIPVGLPGRKGLLGELAERMLSAVLRRKLPGR